MSGAKNLIEIMLAEYASCVMLFFKKKNSWKHGQIF
jgi:hypothetical protein